MPLLRKEPFVKAPVPMGLKPDDEVFYVALTGEIFTDYDDFFKRTILLNSLVWTCSATGRSGLTYEEALNSERSSHDTLDVFPDNLERPLTFLVSLTCRGRIDDLVFDIWSFCKERYLVGEAVEVCYKGSKSYGKILAVKYVGSKGTVDQHGSKMDVSDFANDEQDEVYASGRRKPRADYRAPPPNAYYYDIVVLPKKNLDDLISSNSDSALLKSYPKAQLSPHEILRRRYLLTKQKCRIFVKTVCEPRNGFWVVRDAASAEYKLQSTDWSKDVFDGPLPIFRKTPASRRSVLASHDESQLPSGSGRRQRVYEGTSTKSKRRSQTPEPAMTEHQMKLRQFVEKQEMALSSLIDECNRYNVMGSGKELSLDDFPLDSIDVDLNEQILAELRERAKKAKDEEKERHREMKRKEKEAIMEWRKPRDDLHCDDHRPLPDLPSVQCPSFLPVEYFGDVLALLEFLTSFGDELNLREYFPTVTDGAGRVSLAVLYEALGTKEMEPLENGESEQKGNGRERAGSILMKLFKLLLVQVFRRLAEEDGDEADLDNREDLQHENCDLDHPYYGKIVENATRASESVRNTHGMSIRHLQVDSVTLTEVLRLHFVASGYYPGSNPGRFRYQSRGGYRCWDDPGMTFRAHNPDLMERLSKFTIFELDAVDRLKLLSVLSHQLLTFSTMRFPLHQKTERLQALRYEIRQLQLNDQKQERDALTSKLCKQESRAAAVLANGQLDDDQKYDPDKPSIFVQRLRKYLPKSLPKNESGEPCGEITWESIEEESQSKIKVLMNEVDYEAAALEEIDDIREVQRQIFFHDERRLVEQIYRLQTACGMVILGRDRAYRRYNLLTSLGGILVEQSDHTIGECTDSTGTPIDRVEGANGKNDPRRIQAVKQSLMVCTGNPHTCPVHHSPHKSPDHQWFLIHTIDALDELAAALNRRGFRETELLENLEFFRPFIERAFEQCPTDVLLQPWKEVTDGGSQSVKEYCRDSLKEAMLDFEERVASGNFGGLRGRARDQWRQAIEKDLVVQLYKQSNGSEATNCDEIDEVKIRPYAKHLSDLVAAIHHKSYRKSFTEPHGRYVEGEFIETGSNSLGLWKTALNSATSYSQLHLHVATLDNAIAWNKSSSQMRCRLCRRKGDVQTFLECDVCERLYHSACLKPPAATAPDPVTHRWCCPDCAPKTLHQQKGVLMARDEDDDDGAEEDEEDEYCEGCGGTLKSARRRFTCCSCGATYHPTCAVASGSSKWTKAEISRWKCDNCAAEETSTPAEPDNSQTSSVPNRSYMVNDSDTGSDNGHQNGVSFDANDLSSRLSSSITSTRTGRVIKKPKSFDDVETADPTKSPKKKVALAVSNGGTSSHSLGKTSVISSPSTRKTSTVAPTNASNWQTTAAQLLQDLSSHADAWPFLKPVTKKIAPDYFTIIKTPMDLSTLRTKLYKNSHMDADEFIADLELIFQNCRAYNGPTAPVYQCGVRLEEFSKSRLAELFPNVSPKRSTLRKHSIDDGVTNGDSGHDTRKKKKRDQ